MRTALVMVCLVAFSIAAAQTAQAAIPLDTTGRAPGSPMLDGTPPPLSTYELGHPNVGITMLSPPAYASGQIDLTPGSAGAPMYDPSGPLPAPVNPEATSY